MFVLDRAQNIVLMNSTFVAGTGMSTEKLQDKNLWEVWCPEKFAEMKAMYASVTDTGQPRHLTSMNQEYGTTLEIHARPFNEFVVVTCVDVTEWANREAAVAKQMEAAQLLMQRLNVASSEAQQQAETDVLTGLPNRRRANDLAGSIFQAMAGSRLPFSVLAIDIDHFKRFNDDFGHDEGDKVLAAVGETLRFFVKSDETPARIGGEEFVVLCPGTGLLAAKERAQTLLEQIRAIRGTCAPVTASIGVASVAQTDDHWTCILKRADEALYAAKENGRDQVRCNGTDLGILADQSAA